MTDKPRNGKSDVVTLFREEYDALMSREETVTEMRIDSAKHQLKNAEMVDLINNQMKQLASTVLKTEHLERINGLQHALLDFLRDPVKVAHLSDLSEFWRQWVIASAKEKNADDVAKFEPNLFKSWRNWTNDAGKTERTLNVGGTRLEIEAKHPPTVREMQEHIIRRYREDNVKLAAKTEKLEAELAAFKAVKAP